MNIFWKPVVLRDVGSGEPFAVPPYGSSSPLLLLHKIQAMPKRTPLSLKEAAWIAATEACKRFSESGGEASAQFMNTWIEWLIDYGFHIELTGEEFEMEILGEA